MIDLATLIAHVESDDRPYAMRFEPSVMNRAIAGKWSAEHDAVRRIHACSHSTAHVVLATSWGRYQIMGFNLYGAMGTTVPVGQWMATDQAPSFTWFVNKGGFDAHVYPIEQPDDWFEKFARFYNGPGQPAVYAKRMKEVLAQLGG